MWTCTACRIDFRSESIEYHLIRNHCSILSRKPFPSTTDNNEEKSAPAPEIFQCGQCEMTGIDLNQMAWHCSLTGHDPTEVIKNADLDGVFTEKILAALRNGTIVFGPPRPVSKRSSTKESGSSAKTTRPTNDNADSDDSEGESDGESEDSSSEEDGGESDEESESLSITADDSQNQTEQQENGLTSPNRQKDKENFPPPNYSEDSANLSTEERENSQTENPDSKSENIRNEPITGSKKCSRQRSKEDSAENNQNGSEIIWTDDLVGGETKIEENDDEEEEEEEDDGEESQQEQAQQLQNSSHRNAPISSGATGNKRPKLTQNDDNEEKRAKKMALLKKYVALKTSSSSSSSPERHKNLAPNPVNSAPNSISPRMSTTPPTMPPRPTPILPPPPMVPLNHHYLASINLGPPPPTINNIGHQARPPVRLLSQFGGNRDQTTTSGIISSSSFPSPSMIIQSRSAGGYVAPCTACGQRFSRLRDARIHHAAAHHKQQQGSLTMSRQETSLVAAAKDTVKGTMISCQFCDRQFKTVLLANRHGRQAHHGSL